MTLRLIATKPPDEKHPAEHPMRDFNEMRHPPSLRGRLRLGGPPFMVGRKFKFAKISLACPKHLYYFIVKYFVLQSI